MNRTIRRLDMLTGSEKPPRRIRIQGSGRSPDPGQSHHATVSQAPQRRPPEADFEALRQAVDAQISASIRGDPDLVQRVFIQSSLPGIAGISAAMRKLIIPCNWATQKSV